MSKEVKLGLAIGGILLSVVLVSMMVMSGDPAPQEQVVLELPPQPEPVGTTPPAPIAPDLATATPGSLLPAQGAGPSTQPESTPAVADARPETKNDPWVDLLATGRFEQTSTPVPPAPAAPETRPGTADRNPAPPTRDTASPGSDRPVSSVARTHQVQRGETYSSISAAAYGSAAYFAHIIRANPGIDPSKLRPGMIINLPPESQVKAISSPRAEQARTIDERTEYRVQGNDSLYKIAMKLYGKPEYQDKLYDTNKATIGADKSKLHVGVILRLPEAPLVSR